MKYLVFILSFLFVETTFAIYVDHNSAPPTWFVLSADGWYYQDGNTTDRYKPSTSSSSAGTANRKGWDSPNLEDVSNITGDKISNEKLKSGDLTMDDIPLFISGIIQFVLGVAGTLSIVALIYHSVQMQLNSGITGDSTGVEKAKKWMYGALIGFVITILAWFIVTRVVQILTSIT